MRIKFGFPMTAGEIAESVKGKGTFRDNQIITHLTTDSREVNNGDLFIALNGKNKSGEDFVTDALSRGALVMSSRHIPHGITVDNTNTALLNLSYGYSKKLPYLLYRIGITGSVGKTTTKEFARIVLSQRYKVHSSPGNYNNSIGMPLSILSAPYDTQILLMEMGMNHIGEISELSKTLRPDVGIITNIGYAHIGNLGSREQIAKAKQEILHGMNGGLLLVPDEEELLASVAYRTGVSIENMHSDFFLRDNEDGTLSFYLYGDLFCNVKFSLRESHHKKALAFALSSAAILGLTDYEMDLGASSISADNTRQKIVRKGDLLFLTDLYNSSPEAIQSCIEAARYINDVSRKSLLLGDVLELGDMSETIHFKIGKSIPPCLFQNIYLFGEYAEAVRRGAIDAGIPTENIMINKNIGEPKTTAEQIKQRSVPNEIIVMKASRGVKLERILDFFD